MHSLADGGAAPGERRRRRRQEMQRQQQKQMQERHERNLLQRRRRRDGSRRPGSGGNSPPAASSSAAAAAVASAAAVAGNAALPAANSVHGGVRTGGGGGGGAGGGGDGKHCVCMVSDFFYPSLGGVEMHIWSLSQCLMRRGHRVIVVTTAVPQEGRVGVRFMTNGLKVYYVPVMTFTSWRIAFPTLYAFLPLFRNILIREQVSIVHGHQSGSTLQNECLLYARTMGYRACYTDHSLFNFSDSASIHLNKVMQWILSDVDQAICVSNACRENLVLRARVHPSMVTVIPNAIDPSKFTPDPSRRDPRNTINIVVLGRLVYRKGVDLVAQVIPLVCERYPHVYFIVAGDGPKRVMLEEMRERHQLHERVELLGGVQHDAVRDVHVRGHIFLNCSLTESFGIAILEAAACGLYVVSTRVGGIPEVLPPSMIRFSSTDVADIVDAVGESLLQLKRVVPSELHERVRGLYSWYKVAVRTEEEVYNVISQMEMPTLAQRLARYASLGPIAGIGACIIAIFMHLVYRVVCWLFPASDIDRCPDACAAFRRSSTAPTSTKTTATSAPPAPVASTASPFSSYDDNSAHDKHGRAANMALRGAPANEGHHMPL